MPNGLYCGRKKVCKLKQFIPIKLSVSGQAGTFNDYFRNKIHGYFVNVHNTNDIDKFTMGIQHHLICWLYNIAQIAEVRL